MNYCLTFKKGFMKKLYYISIVFILLFLSIGCTKKQTTNTEMPKVDTLNTVVDTVSVDTLK